MLQTGVFLNDRLRSVGIKSGWKVVGFLFNLQMRRLRLKNTIDAVGEWGSPKLKNAVMV